MLLFEEAHWKWSWIAGTIISKTLLVPWRGQNILDKLPHHPCKKNLNSTCNASWAQGYKTNDLFANIHTQFSHAQNMHITVSISLTQKSNELLWRLGREQILLCSRMLWQGPGNQKIDKDTMKTVTEKTSTLRISLYRYSHWVIHE